MSLKRLVRTWGSLKSKASTHGPSDNQLVKAAKSAGNVVKGTMPKLLYTKYKDIQKPKLSFLARQWKGMRGNKVGQI